MKITKKGQTATEYLIILAVVIIIAIVVAKLLGGFPGIGGNLGFNSKKGYWSTTDIAVPRYDVSNLGYGTLILRNHFTTTITITDVHSANTSGRDQVWESWNGSDFELKRGEEVRIMLYEVRGAAHTYTPGEKISYYLNITYDDSLGTSHSINGKKPIEVKISNN